MPKLAPTLPEPPPDARPYAQRVLQALGEKITQARLARGWNRTRLAREARVTVTTIRGLESGKKITQPAKLQTIARALGLSATRLELDDGADPRVRNWTSEDYIIGAWYHNAPRALKNRIWLLQDAPGAVAALVDPIFTPVLEGWAALDATGKQFVVQTFLYMQQQRSLATSNDDSGGIDALASAHSKTRGSER